MLICAVRLLDPGRPLAVEEVELPDPGPDEIRVDLAFGGVNPVDRYLAEGRVAPDAPRPRTVGGEASGYVDGRPVLVAGEGLGTARDGVWAQAAVVPVAAVLDLPAGVEPTQAAAMGIAGLTALNCVRTVARVGEGDRVFVTGASGGVGTMMVSLAHAAGAVVWGQTGSEDKVAVITEMGAERVLVGEAEQIAPGVAELAPTVVLDSLGGGFMAPLVAATEPRGRIVSLGTSAGPEVAFNMRQLYRNMLTLYGYGGMQLTRHERRPGLEAALRAVAEGELKVVIDAVLPLADVNEAFARLARREVRGKLVLDLS